MNGPAAVTTALAPPPGPSSASEKVLRLVAGLRQRFAVGPDFAVTPINGSPALLARAGETPAGALRFGFRGRVVTDVRAVVNPDKLEFLGRQPARG